MTPEQEAATSLPDCLEGLAKFYDPANFKEALQVVILTIAGKGDQIIEVMNASSWNQKALDYMEANEPGWDEMKPAEKVVALRAKAAWERQALEAGHD